MTLRALQSAANNQRTTAPMSWIALNNAGHDIGAPSIDYDRFAARWETDPILKLLVDKFDGQGITVKTAAPSSTVSTDDKQSSEISKMAKRATQKAAR